MREIQSMFLTSVIADQFDICFIHARLADGLDSFVVEQTIRIDQVHIEQMPMALGPRWEPITGPITSTVTLAFLNLL